MPEQLRKHDFIKYVANERTVRLTPRGCNETKHVAVVKLMGDLRQQLSKLGLDGSDYQKIAWDITDIEGETKGYNADFTVVQKHLSSTRTVLEGLADSHMAIVLIQQIDALQKRIGA